jgi:uncharacterized protein
MTSIYEPWPWYVAGPIIGLTVPLLLLMGNKRLGVSSSLRHICAACLPFSKIPLFNYDWRKETWSLFFVGGILFGGFIGGYVLGNPNPVQLSSETGNYLQSFGINYSDGGLLPKEIFSWDMLLTLKGFLMMAVGGYLVGFGTRYAQGCTSGHGIFGLATFQWPSLVATICFFVGGIIVNRFVLPVILSL